MIDCHDRFKFNVLRFQDANFGVAEKRSNEFCEALVEAGSPFWWNGTYEIETIARYKDGVARPRCASRRCHMAALGAEAGSQEQQARIKKEIKIDDIEKALRELYVRGIQTGCSGSSAIPAEIARVDAGDDPAARPR